MLPNPRLGPSLLYAQAQPRDLGGAVGQVGAGAHCGEGYALGRYIRYGVAVSQSRTYPGLVLTTVPNWTRMRMERM
mgnify:CR=1 FL=1